MDNYRRITSDQLKEQLKEGQTVLLLDLRPYADFENEHIAGSLNLSLEHFCPRVFLQEHHQRPLILICASGKIAYQAADMLIESGFHDFKVLAGGLLSWRVLGFPLVGKKR